MTSTFIVRKPGCSSADAYRHADLFGSNPGRSNMFMIVDDCPIYLDFLKTTAESFLNCEVATFDSPIDAWTAFRRNPEMYRGIITDFNMPQMTGLDLIQRIRATHPDLPMVLISGEAQPEHRFLREDNFSAFIGKPFEWTELMRRIDAMDPRFG